MRGAVFNCRSEVHLLLDFGGGETRMRKNEIAPSDRFTDWGWPAILPRNVIVRNLQPSKLVATHVGFRKDAYSDMETSEQFLRKKSLASGPNAIYVDFDEVE